MSLRGHRRARQSAELPAASSLRPAPATPSTLVPSLNPSTPTAHLFDGELVPPFGMAPNRMHDTRRAAPLIGVAVSSMETDRTRRRWKIPAYKIGSRKVMYKESDLIAFLERCREVV